MTTATKKRYLGLAEESSFGTKVTDPYAFTYADGKTAGLDSPKKRIDIFEGLTTDAPLVVAAGGYVPSGDLDFPLDAQTLGYLLKFALGNYSEVERLDASPEVYRHTFTGRDTLDSFTVLEGKDLFEHAFQGCKINNLTLTIPKSGFADCKISVLSQKDSKNAIQDPDNLTIPRVCYFNSHHASVSIGGSSKPAEKVEVKIGNNIGAEDHLRLGSIFVQEFERGRRATDVSVSLNFTGTDEIEAFWGDTTSPTTTITERSMTITLTGSEIVTGHYFMLTITCPRVAVEEVSQPVSGRNRLTQELKIKPLHDTTVDYEIQFQLKNGYETYSLTPFYHGIFAQSTSKVWAVGTTGKINYTANGGTAWTAQTSGITGIDARINAVYFASSTVGYAVGDNGKIFKTADGGSTWVAQTSPVTKDLFGVYAASTSVVVAVGKDATIIATSDGSAWAAQTAPVSITGDLHAVHGVSTTTWVTVGANGKIAKTTDGGTNWTAATSGTTNDLLGVAGFNNTTDQWIAVGEDGKVLGSTDATTWANQTSNTATTLRSVSLASLTVGIAVGDDGEVITTSDGGTTWVQRTSDYTNRVLHSVNMASATVGYACGQFGLLLKTTDAGVNWAQI